jgi:hypothetical protein
MRRRGANVLAAVRLRVEPADSALLKRDVATLAPFTDQPPVEAAQRHHDAIGMIVRARPLSRLVSVLEDPDTIVLEDNLVLVGIGLRRIGQIFAPFVT